jgi:hypothetical protein
MKADIADKELMGSVALLDPIRDWDKESPLNLPFIIICYLVRRLAASELVHLTSLFSLCNRSAPNIVSSVIVNLNQVTRHLSHMSATLNFAPISIMHITEVLLSRSI